MSIYSEIDGRTSGERGEWAPLNYATQVNLWRSWRDAAFVVGPVSTAYEGINPVYDRRIVFDEPALIIAGRIRLSRRFVGFDIDYSADTPTTGIVVDYPLVFDDENRAFAEVRDHENIPLTHIWVDSVNAQAIRALRGMVPYLMDDGTRAQVDAKSLRIGV